MRGFKANITSRNHWIRSIQAATNFMRGFAGAEEQAGNCASMVTRVVRRDWKTNSIESFASRSTKVLDRGDETNPMTELCRLLIAILFTWRITHLLQAEDGPWDFSLRIRQAAGEGFIGGALDCFNCLSLWVALPTAWLMRHHLIEMALAWPAISGGAILLERATSGRYVGGDAPPAPFEEDKREG